MSMPKLLQINVTANWGSTGKIAEAIGNAAIAQGWESYIAYGRMANTSASTLIKVGNRCDQLWHGVVSRLFDRHGLASRHATRQLVEEIERIQPDIIHLHNIHGYYLNYQTLFDYLKKADRPVVWSLHDCWSFTGHCSHFVTAGCERWKTQCHDCPLLGKEYPKSWVVDRSQKNYLQKRKAFTDVKQLVLVPVSQWLAGLVKESFLGSYPIHCIQNGIDLQQFIPCGERTDVLMKWGINPTTRVVLGVASVWEKRKGFDDMMALWQYLSKEYTIVLVGVTDKQKAALPDGIVGINRTNDVRELAELYSAADVYVNPTYADTFPTTNLEALACGTPVVTYRTGGSSEAVDEATGRVVEVGDVAALAVVVQDTCSAFKGSSALQRSKSSMPFGRSSGSNACRKRAERLFDKNSCFEKYVGLYTRLARR